MTPRLKEFYTKEAVPALMKERKYSNIMQVPKLTKITLNMRLQNVNIDQCNFIVAIKSISKIARDCKIHTNDWLRVILEKVQKVAIKNRLNTSGS